LSGGHGQNQTEWFGIPQTSYDVTIKFARGGRFYEAEVPASELLKQTIETSTENEYPLRNGSDRFKIIEKKIQFNVSMFYIMNDEGDMESIVI